MKDASKRGTGFCLRELGIQSECGKVSVSVQGGKELVDGKIGWVIRREENVGDVV